MSVLSCKWLISGVDALTLYELLFQFYVDGFHHSSTVLKMQTTPQKLNTPIQSVRTEEAFQMRGLVKFKKVKQGQLPLNSTLTWMSENLHSQ